MSMQIAHTPLISPSRRRILLARRWIVQVAVVAVVLALVLWLGFAIRNALAAKGIQFSFGYLATTANISLSEGMTVALDGLRPIIEAFEPSHTNAQALIAGLANTLKVALAAILLSTVFGTLLGVGRLSTNWLVRNLAFGLVELVRNTPILIQIVFWYFAVVLRFPPASAASGWFGGLIMSQSGVYLPGLTASAEASSAGSILAAVAAVCVVAIFFAKARAWRLGLALAAMVAAVMSYSLGLPFELDAPVATRFGARGGINLTPEFTAILLAIVVNSSAYVAEIVRGAIDALPKGQWEASAALGLSRSHTLRDIILPQVFRVVLPSLANRYISLTKDTSLGIAIGFPDLFNVYGTVSNQTGRNLEGVLIVMATYLILSWIISAVVNLLNSWVNAQGEGR